MTPTNRHTIRVERREKTGSNAIEQLLQDYIEQDISPKLLRVELRGWVFDGHVVLEPQGEGGAVTIEDVRILADQYNFDHAVIDLEVDEGEETPPGWTLINTGVGTE